MSVETTHVLRVDASARTDGSVTRSLADRLVDTLGAGSVTRRDLAAEPIPQISEDWVGANFTAPDERTAEQNARLAQSDALVAELQAADTLVIATPIYNFGVPAALKAWIDMVARARVTFRYTDDGPVGLLAGKKAYIVLASGGTGVDTPIDFATPYLRHVLGFIGIKDVTVVAADGLGRNGGNRAAAEAAITALAA